MKTTAKRLRLGLLLVLLVLMTAPPSFGEIIKWADSSQNRQDLFLLGLGELTMHMLSVDGNQREFEEANPNYKADFTTNYRMSLFANGNATRGLMINGAAILDSRIDDEYRTFDPSEFRLKMSATSTEPIWDTWRFTGYGVYDPNREWELANLDTRLLTQPQEPARMELLMKLESDQHGIVEGGSIRPSFKNAKFTLYQRSIFGVYADLHTETVGVEAVGGKLEGKKFRQGAVEGIRADGTTGPYDIDYAPLVRGSEEVKIEVRDRYNESTVLSSETLTRNVDYTIDYLRGRVLLHRPVASETISSDPVYIVITADYWREDNDEIVGGRANLNPRDGVTMSGSYLHRIIDDNATGAGIDEPEDLYAVDATFEGGRNTSGYVEFAGSETDDTLTSEGETFDALRFGLKSEVLKDLTLNADYQRIEDDFRSFTNSSLDPNKNQQRWNVGGQFEIDSSQTATASYTNIRGLEADGDYNRYEGLRDEKILALGYENQFRRSVGLGVKFERRDVTDRRDATHEDNYQNRFIVDLGGEFDDFGFLGDVDYAVGFERIAFRNDAGVGRNDANTNQFVASLKSRPTERTQVELAQRVTYQKDLFLDTYDERWDASFATLQWRLHENVNTLATYEYKRMTVPGDDLSLWNDNPVKTDEGMSFALEYLPLTDIKALAKFGRHDAKSGLNGLLTRSVDDFALAQFTYFHTHHLSFDLETEYTWEAEYYANHSRDQVWDLGLRVNWNRDRLNEWTAGLIRRWNKVDEGEAQTYIMLASGSLSLTRTIFARGSIKETLLNKPLDDEKMFTRLELGYDSHDWFRVSVGFERIAGGVDDSSSDYTATGGFIRFTGKM